MAVFYLCCLGGNNVFANDIELKRHVEYDENGQMRVWLSGSSDKENESFVFVVLNPGYELNDIEENSKAALQYQDLVVSDEVGKFGFEFKIYGDNYGDFKVYCANDEAMVISRQNADDMKNFIDDELLMCQAVLEDTLKNKENIIALDKIDEFKSVDKEKLSERVYEKLKSLNDVSDEYTVFEKFNEIKAILNRYSVIEVFNQNIAGFEFIENNKFLYGDIIGVSEAEIKNKTSFQECFEKVLSDEGRKKVIESLMNKNISSEEEFCKLFSENVVLFGTKYHAEEGYGHIEKLLNENNLKYLGMDLKVELTSTRQKKLAEKNDAFKNISEMTAFINNIEDKKVPSGSGSGSGGGKGSSVSLPIGYGEKEIEKETAGLLFSDMTDEHWAAEAVAYLKSKNIINGKNENIFAPDESVKREEFAKILCKALELKILKVEEIEPIFKDVDNNSWYAPYIYTLYNEGIVKGVSDDTFGVGMNIKRQDLCVMAKRAFFEETDADNTVEFADYEGISDYAKNAVNLLFEKRIVNGYSDGTFRPNNYCARAEAAKIVYSILKGGA